jgi:4-hydroxy-4-methyl-2-oxoglutarate aldolase
MSVAGARPSMNESILDQCDGLYPAVISDILDELGHRHQVMAPRIRPLYPTATVFGFARTLRAEAVDGPPADKSDNYRNQIAAVESVMNGHVLVVSTVEVCVWGELLSLAAQKRGARGIVIDGYTRDCQGVIDLGFPTFTAGIHAADALGRVDVKESGGEIVSAGVRVCDGDLIIGNYDGVVVVPLAIAEEVIERARQKVSGENLVRTKLAEGMSVSDTFAQYGIL